jgi:hypothetical protein
LAAYSLSANSPQSGTGPAENPAFSRCFSRHTVFPVTTGDKVIETAARCQLKLMTKGKVRLIYAGQTAFTVGSEQLGAGDWDGVLMFEYSNRAEFEEQSAAGDIFGSP